MIPQPTPAQLEWQRLGIGALVHFGTNTFTDREWGDGTAAPDVFDPTGLDADQWVAALKDAGGRYLVLTAKHHDGFCLWPTVTTPYSVASSSWREGRGDVVREVADACARHGILFGVYLSPWDRHADLERDDEQYRKVYIQQLTELCTNYGPLTEIWFDGAGSDDREYDLDGITSVIRQHQPDAMVFNIGPVTIRWIGNEDGLAEDPVEYGVSRTFNNLYTDAITQLGSVLYLPPECDVPVRRGWFWHADDEPKSVEHLMAIYYRSVGMGANLLLGLAPNREGLLAEDDVLRLREWRREREARFSHQIEARVVVDGETVSLLLPEDVTFDHVELVEELSAGQRVERHEIVVDDDVVASGLTVGVRRIHQIESTSADRLTVRLSGAGATLAAAYVYRGDVPRSVPQLPVGYEPYPNPQH